MSGNPSSCSGGTSATTNGIPIRNLWHMLLYAWGEARYHGRWDADIEDSPTLDALFASILVKLLRRRLRIGLGRQFQENDTLVFGIRGRIKFAESAKRLLFLHGEACCRFQSFDPNVKKNQIIRSVLALLLQRGQFGGSSSATGELRQSIRGVIRDLDGVDLIEISSQIVRREQESRHDADYRMMLAICGIIVESYLPKELAGSSELPKLDHSAMVLWKVFETFVAQFYSMRLLGWDVKAQSIFRWNDASRFAFLPVLKPDVVLRHLGSQTRVILDTKFTPRLFASGAWGGQKFRSDHLFQMYAYLRSQEHLSEVHRRTTGILLYPAVNQVVSHHAIVDGHCIKWHAINLTQSWEKVESDLLGLMNECVSLA